MIFFSNHNEIYDVLHKLKKSKSSLNMNTYVCDVDNGLNLSCDQAKFLKYILKIKSINNNISIDCGKDKCLNKNILLDNLKILKKKINSFKTDLDKLYNNQISNDVINSTPTKTNIYSSSSMSTSSTSYLSTNSAGIFLILLLVGYIIGGTFLLGKYINDKLTLQKYKKYIDNNFTSFNDDLNKLLDDLIEKINKLDTIKINNICVNNVNVINGKITVSPKPIKCKKSEYLNIKSINKKLIKLFLKNLNKDNE